jgi:catalase
VFPQWDFGVQVFSDTDDEMFEGIDLLDPTKFVPKELAPVQVIGTLTLNANPTNCFAETEQVAFHPGHLVPGIDVTNDPLLQGRLFSYIDTQISRLGGPNFAQIPINRPHAQVNDMLRDGMHQSAVHGGVAPYRPNSLDGGCPFVAGVDSGAFIECPQPVAGRKVREQPATFDDHYSQARLCFQSLSPVEQDHVTQAYTFELSKCYEENIKVRQLQALANIDQRLCADVALGLGLPAPDPTEELTSEEPSPAVSQVGGNWPIEGRQIGIIADETTDPGVLDALLTDLRGAGMVPLVVAPNGGKLGSVVVQRTYLTAASIEFDAIILATAAAPAPDALQSRDAKAGDPSSPSSVDPRVAKILAESWRHAKAIGAVGEGSLVLEGAGLPIEAPGVSVGDTESVISDFLTSLASHRAWERFPTTR